ncbi:MAG: hypothetical protein A2521_05175 [Deltaproteobacteria bacterium RIFOXYD12_FULL_57_12]|nr:MAG: hypothetical protein A2521_05175 [Deltaproteobacteria bacterium RIFOXYD12_FULL_57_12]
MKSSTTDRFWKCYAVLPKDIRRQAREAYELFAKDPYYPSLHFKRIHSTRPIFSARISTNYRAVGVVEGDEITWFWVGSHADYDNILKR